MLSYMACSDGGYLMQVERPQLLQVLETFQKHNILHNPTDKKKLGYRIANKPTRKDFKIFIYYFIFYMQFIKVTFVINYFYCVNEPVRQRRVMYQSLEI